MKAVDAWVCFFLFRKQRTAIYKGISHFLPPMPPTSSRCSSFLKWGNLTSLNTRKENPSRIEKSHQEFCSDSDKKSMNKLLHFVIIAIGYNPLKIVLGTGRGFPSFSFAKNKSLA